MSTSVACISAGIDAKGGRCPCVNANIKAVRGENCSSFKALDSLISHHSPFYLSQSSHSDSHVPVTYSKMLMTSFKMSAEVHHFRLQGWWPNGRSKSDLYKALEPRRRPFIVQKLKIEYYKVDIVHMNPNLPPNVVPLPLQLGSKLKLDYSQGGQPQRPG